MFSTKIRPRVSETDGVGHINNVFVPVWFEAGREEIFKILMPDLSFRDWKVALVNMNVDYTNQLQFGKEVEIRTWIECIGNKSFTIYEEVHQENNLCAKGTVTYVYMNYHSQYSERIPDSVRNKFSEHLRSEGRGVKTFER